MNEKQTHIDLPSCCPLCGEAAIEVTGIRCPGCGSEITGTFYPQGLERLPVEYQKFITVFLACRGNISQVEKQLHISYPTINKMLDSINHILRGSLDEKPLSRKEILDSIERGDMSPKDAADMLRAHKKGD